MGQPKRSTLNQILKVLDQLSDEEFEELSKLVDGQVTAEESAGMKKAHKKTKSQRLSYVLEERLTKSQRVKQILKEKRAKDQIGQSGKACQKPNVSEEP